MKILKIISYGALLWILMFVIISAFIGFKIQDSLFIMILGAVIGGIISFFLAKKLALPNIGMALSSGLIFVLVGVILDAIITVKFVPGIFMEWNLWLGNILIFLVPAIAVKK